MSDHKVLLDAISGLKGVDGVVFATDEPRNIEAKVTDRYTSETVENICNTAFELLPELSKDISELNEIRFDMGSISILMIKVSNGLLIVMIENQDVVDLVSAAISGICMVSLTQDNESSITPKKSTSSVLTAEPNFDRDSRYVDETRIGEGGTSVIFKAYDTRLNREVALKRYKEDENPETKEDYLSELESASRIQHHNVISTIDANIDSNGRFMVMEFIDGADLESLVAERPLSLERFPSFAAQALEGLLATHQGGLLHLDLKPSNMMLSVEPGGRDHVKIIDYGRARPAKTEDNGEEPRGSGLSGSIFYASPEFLREEPLDVRADLYSLGCIFYWALSGQRPFDGPSPLMVMAAHLQHQVTDLSEIAPHVPRRLSTWVMSLIKSDKELRPKSAEEALDSLARRRLLNVSV